MIILLGWLETGLAQIKYDCLKTTQITLKDNDT